jgi:hypothetical protein
MQIREKATDSTDCLPPTFATRIGLIKIGSAIMVDLNYRHAV